MDQLVGRRHDRYLQDFNYHRAHFYYENCMEYGVDYFKLLFYTREAKGEKWDKDFPKELVQYGMESAAHKLALNSCQDVRKEWGEQSRKRKAQLIAERDTHMMIQQYARGSSLPYHPYL